MKILQEAVSDFSNSISGVDYPPCFKDAEQYQKWSDAENDLPTSPIRKFVCRDCTKSYQSKMVATSRCLIPMIPVEMIARGI